jgi:hypothetical protein
MRRRASRSSSPALAPKVRVWHSARTRGQSCSDWNWLAAGTER